MCVNIDLRPDKRVVKDMKTWTTERVAIFLVFFVVMKMPLSMHLDTV